MYRFRYPEREFVQGCRAFLIGGTSLAVEVIKVPAALGLRRTLSGHTNYIGPLAWSPDGALLASGSGDNTVRIWNWLSGETSQVLTGHTEGISALAWSPDGRLLASGSADRTVRIWSTMQGLLVHALTGQNQFVRSVEWVHDGSTLLSGSQGDIIRFWNAANGTKLRSLRPNHGWVLCLKRSNEGTGSCRLRGWERGAYRC